MSERVYRLLEGTLSRFKARPYTLDRGVPLGVLAAVLLRRSFWLMRGFCKGLLLQRRFVFVFMAGGVNLRGASLIRFGKGVTLERGVIIDGLMRHGVQLGAHVRIGPYSTLVGAPISNLGEGITIGANSAVDAYSFIGSAGPVTIGENVIMGQHVCFHPENHNFDRTDVPIKLQGTVRQGITIEDDVWIGANVTFLDGAHVGRGCVIGAGSLVRGSIPAYSVAVGAPARIIRSRNPQNAPVQSAHTLRTQ
ncbi:MAG TPA: acyltransferase [Candidatus Angelobacter sp.]|nr:acyltransferase [Candidatus Angelobacter sp.]